MPKDIAPFEVGYEMAALRLCNKRVSLGILNLPCGSILLCDSSDAFISRYFWQSLSDFVAFTKLTQLNNSTQNNFAEKMLI